MLCSDCEKLGLSPERFQYPLDESSTALGSEHSCHKLTRKVKGDDNCRLCQLIHRSVTATDSDHINDETECTIEWVKDGQQIASTDLYGRRRSRTTLYDPASRRRSIRISWSPPNQDNGLKREERESLYLLYVPSRDPTHPDTGPNLQMGESFFLTEDYNKDIYGWIRSWIQLCEKEHQNAYTQIEDKDVNAFCDLTRETWFCVVDVDKMCLTNLKLGDQQQPEPYAALSYVWGTERESSHRTLLSNIMSRTKDGGIDWDTLPRTIQDAIRLVRTLALGVRYIWIDALCIAQDSFISWKHNAEKMDLIFGNAYFTICAADGDSSSGLRAMDPKTKDSPIKQKVKEDLELLVSNSPESVIQSSLWSTRGWTFQERILSRRCLVFAGGRIYLQCRENNYDCSSTNWSSDWRKFPLCTVKGLKDRPMWFYMNCVELYTGRALTRPKDILEAFNGVSRVIEERMCARFFFGLPSSHFDFALLWRPKLGKKRLFGDQQKDEEFPSWSWSGWQEKTPQKGSAVYYPRDILEGCLLDLHRWLLFHTWIVWYIRDSNGDLEPLWQGYTAEHTNRSQDVANRWKGYQSAWDSKIEGNKNHISAYGRERQHFDDPSPQTFRRTLPSNPFGVRVSRVRKESYQPILQFWTWKCEFYVTPNKDCPSPGGGLVRLDILDRSQDWCGTVVVDESWVKKQKKDDKLHEFIALSDARKFTDYECTSWVYPIPKNLEDIDWDLYHVMLVKYCKNRCVWERIGLGKVLKAAFEPLEDSQWTEMTLG